MKRLSPSRITKQPSMRRTELLEHGGRGRRVRRCGTIAPSATAPAQGMSGTSRRATTAPTTMVTATAPTARRRRRLRLDGCGDRPHERLALPIRVEVTPERDLPPPPNRHGRRLPAAETRTRLHASQKPAASGAQFDVSQSGVAKNRQVWALGRARRGRAPGERGRISSASRTGSRSSARNGPTGDELRRTLRNERRERSSAGFRRLGLKCVWSFRKNTRGLPRAGWPRYGSRRK